MFFKGFQPGLYPLDLVDQRCKVLPGHRFRFLEPAFEGVQFRLEAGRVVYQVGIEGRPFGFESEIADNLCCPLDRAARSSVGRGRVI